MEVKTQSNESAAKALLWSEEFFAILRREIEHFVSRDMKATGFLPTAGGAADKVVRLKQDAGVVIAPDGLPLPPKHLWIGYGETMDVYLWLGKTNAAPMEKITGDAGLRWGSGVRVLDLGCAAGTMIRNLARHAAADEIWGCDINAEAIDWARRHLSPPFRFCTNTTAPHLPFEDRTFDLVYCGSVFTHIHDIADSWMLEIARVLKPGGLLYATIHDQHFIRATLESDPKFYPAQLWMTRLTPQERASDFAQITFGTSHTAQVFYDTDFFIKKIAAPFEHLGTHPRSYGTQTAVLFRKR